jgi:hypothetical protein
LPWEAWRWNQIFSAYWTQPPYARPLVYVVPSFEHAVFSDAIRRCLQDELKSERKNVPLTVGKKVVKYSVEAAQLRYRVFDDGHSTIWLKRMLFLQRHRSQIGRPYRHRDLTWRVVTRHAAGIIGGPTSTTPV